MHNPKGHRAYDIDWNYFAPNFGVTWRPNFDRGLLHAVFGGDPVFRGGLAMAYSRNGMSDFTDLFGANPGIQIDATRSQVLGNLGTPPVLLRETDRLGPPAVQTAPGYPMPDVITEDV